MSRGLHYVTPNRVKGNSPLRSVPLLRSPAEVWGTAFQDGTWNQPAPAPAPVVALPPAPPVALDPARELRAADAAMRDATRVYDLGSE